MSDISLPVMNNPQDQEAVRKAVLSLNSKIIQSSSQIISPYNTALSSSVTYTFQAQTGIYYFLIPANVLIPQSGGAYTITIQSASSNGKKVIVPTGTAGDILFSSNLLITINLDDVGNITSGFWSISGGNSNGTWRKDSNNSQRCYGSYIANATLSTANYFGTTSGNSFFSSDTITFPASFLAGTIPIVTFGPSGDKFISLITTPTATNFIARTIGGASAPVTVYYEAIGSWM